MLCISINQESRRFALVDMLNAGRFGDLLEIRLDRFGKAPELGELLAHKPKPVIMTCRRADDGGFWDGSDEERLAILRQCIISKADYVEIEMDVADTIRRYGPSKRVIGYTNLRETPGDIQEIYDQARGLNPDVIKLVTLARTPEEAWPLVQILARTSVPTVIVGLGKANTMLALLGKKLGAPWIYAALERGMEAYPGQPTIDDLKTIYDVDAIAKGTRFVGVIGHGPRELATIACLNAAFREADMGLRCLPLEVGNLKIFRKLIDVVKLGAVVVSHEHQETMLDLEPNLHGSATTTRAVDLLVSKDETLHGFHKGAKAWAQCLENALKPRFPEQPLKDRFIILVGTGPSVRLLAREINEAGGNPMIATRQKKIGPGLAHELKCRYLPIEAIYTTMHDGLVVCDADGDGSNPPEIHAGYLRPGHIVMDLTAELLPSTLLREAAVRDATVIDPLELFLDQMEELGRMLTNRPVTREALKAAVPPRLLDFE